MQVFEFYCPSDSIKANEVRMNLLQVADDISSELDVELFIKVAMAFHYNGAEVTPVYYIIHLIPSLTAK